MFYDRFEELCREKGVKPGRACSEMGLSRSLAAKWKSTKTEKPSADALEKMSVYFGKSIEEILNGETKKAPTQEDERGIDEQNLKVAFFRGADPTLTDEEIDDMWDDAKDLRDLLIMKKRRERDGK